LFCFPIVFTKAEIIPRKPVATDSLRRTRTTPDGKKKQNKTKQFPKSGIKSFLYKKHTLAASQKPRSTKRTTIKKNQIQELLQRSPRAAAAAATNNENRARNTQKDRHGEKEQGAKEEAVRKRE
jgi:hypothetical protein